MFVAYTGYGRVATMGEEVKDPRKNIPRAIITVTAVSAVLYMAVGLAAIGAYGADALGEATRTQAAPLETVLIYYAITNLSALRLAPEHRLYPRWISRTGIAACLFLAFWVDPAVWMTGLGLIAAGLLWHKARVRVHRS